MVMYKNMDTTQKTYFLGTDIVDASDGILFNAKAKAEIDNNLRTLIIGLGGCGVKTVARIKATIMSKFKNYHDRVGFLALDTDSSELEKLTVLNGDEKLAFGTDQTIKNRFNKKEGRSEFTKTWIYPDFNVPELDGKGACQTRQASRAKMFDAPGAASHTDALIVNAISTRATSILAAFSARTNLQVIVILGVSGGTGSGSLTEIAHLIRRAVTVPHNITGYFMMPDIMGNVLNANAMNNAQENGYAALKELDYYYSIRQRTTPDFFQMSNPTTLPQRFDANSPLYDMVYLINGSGIAPNQEPYKTALDVTAEYIVNQLAESKVEGKDQLMAEGRKDEVFLTESFLSNKGKARAATLRTLYNTDGKEAPGCFGEDNFDYSAIGVSAAVIPEQTTKCYAVREIVGAIACRDAVFTPADFHGFKPVPLTSTAAAPLINNFLSVNVKNMESFIWSTANGLVQWPAEFTVPSHDEILANNVDAYKNMLGADRQQQAAQKKVDEFLNAQFTRFREVLQSFLVDNGPGAYTGIFEGIDVNGNYSLNIRSKLDEPAQHGTAKVSAFSLAGAQSDLADKRSAVEVPILGRIEARHAQWAESYRAFEATRLALHLANYVFGSGGVLQTLYVDPIRRQSDAVAVFSEVFNDLVNVYANMGSKFDRYDLFVKAAAEENAANYNLISAETDYEWTKQIVDNNIHMLNYNAIKAQIVQSFMDDPKAWTEYDEAKPRQTPRRKLDEIMAPYVDFSQDLSLVSFVQHKISAGGGLLETVRGLVGALLVAAQPLYHQDRALPGFGAENLYRYLVVPTLLFIADGGDKVQAAFSTACNEQKISLMPSALTDKLVCYTLATALPLYAQADMQAWQSIYDGAHRIMLHSNESGVEKFDPDKGLAWEDYRALALVKNARLPDAATQKISREGHFLLEKLDTLFDEAMKAGVIFEVQDADHRYSYSCYCLDRPGWTYQLKLEDYPYTDNEGYFQKGERLFTYLAEQNRGKIGDIMQNVALPLVWQGQFNAPHADRELAIDRAKRALRRNEPQLIAIKETLRIMKDLTLELDAANAVKKQQALTLKLPYFIGCGNLTCDEKNWWRMNDYPNPGKTLKIVPMIAAAHLENHFYAAGWTYQVLADKFHEIMAENTEITELYQDSWNALINGDLPASEFHDRMSAFREEAKRFIDAYTGAGKTMVRNALAGELGCSVDKVNDMIRNYAQYVKVDDSIQALM